MKRLCGIVTACVMTFAFLGCKNVNEQSYPECGLQIVIPQEYEEKGLIIEAGGAEQFGIPMFAASFNYKPALDIIFSEIEQASLGKQEIPQELWDSFENRYHQHSKLILMISVLEEAYYKQLISSNDPNIQLSSVLGRKNEYVYLLNVIDNTTEGMSEEELNLYNDCRTYILSAVKKAKFIPIKNSESGTSSALQSKGGSSLPDMMPSFTTTDLDGATVTNDIFAQKDLTVVNVWGTFCGPCINEMPELAQWAKELPQNVQLLGIVSDVVAADDKDGFAAAKDIISKSGVGYTNIIAGSGLEPLLKNIMFVPTTFFVDKNGAIIGDVITGARVEAYKENVTKLLEDIDEK